MSGTGSDNRGDPLSPVYTLFTRLHSVNSQWCAERLRETRTVSFRVPRLAKTLYDDVLSHEDKEQIKYVIEGMIYALARLRIKELPCQELIDKRITALANMTYGNGNVVFNINVSISKAEAKPQVNINIDAKAIEDVVKLLEFLYSEASRNMSYKTRRILEQRVRRAERLLGDLMMKLN